MPKQEFGGNPHIWVKWKEPGDKVPRQRSFTAKYAMRLELGKLSAGKLPGKIYLCVPDQERSFIAGTFDVSIRQRNQPAIGGCEGTGVKGWFCNQIAMAGFAAVHDGVMNVMSPLGDWQHA